MWCGLPVWRHRQQVGRAHAAGSAPRLAARELAISL
jgi:hypothetical protein